MKIEIELKRGTARRMGLVASTVAVLGVAAAVYANQVHFSSGQTLTAADLNSNFDELYAAAAKPTITKNGKSISIGGTYCGASAGPYNGAEVGGYTGAKAKCETKCASATAHICDGAEMVRSEQLGLALPNGAWLASFTSSITPVDCVSWTNGQLNAVGMVWNQSPPQFLAVNCDATHPIACCD
jgi:hypothetical protein